MLSAHGTQDTGVTSQRLVGQSSSSSLALGITDVFLFGFLRYLTKTKSFGGKQTCEDVKFFFVVCLFFKVPGVLFCI